MPMAYDVLKPKGLKIWANRTLKAFLSLVLYLTKYARWEKIQNSIGLPAFELRFAPNLQNFELQDSLMFHLVSKLI